MEFAKTVFVVLATASLAYGQLPVIAPECHGLLDLIVVVDGSDSISEDDFATMKTAITSLLDVLTLGEDHVKFGLVLYSSNITTVLDLSGNEKQLRTQIAAMSHARQGTNTHLGIQKMNSMFAQHGRKEVPKAAIVITDGNSKQPNETASEAALAKNNDTDMYVVGITKHIDMDELKKIASSDEKVVSLETFDQLKTGIISVMKQVCPTTTTTSPTTPTVVTVKSTVKCVTSSIKCVTSICKLLIPSGFGEVGEERDDDVMIPSLHKHAGESADDDDYPAKRPSLHNQPGESADEDDYPAKRPSVHNQPVESADEDNYPAKRPSVHNQPGESADEDNYPAMRPSLHKHAWESADEDDYPAMRPSVHKHAGESVDRDDYPAMRPSVHNRPGESADEDNYPAMRPSLHKHAGESADEDDYLAMRPSVHKHAGESADEDNYPAKRPSLHNQPGESANEDNYPAKRPSLHKHAGESADEDDYPANQNMVGRNGIWNKLFGKYRKHDNNYSNRSRYIPRRPSSYSHVRYNPLCSFIVKRNEYRGFRRC